MRYLIVLCYDPSNEKYKSPIVEINPLNNSNFAR